VFDALENFSDVGLLSCLARRQLGRQENNFSEVLMGLRRQKIFSVVAFFHDRKIKIKFSDASSFIRQKSFLKKFCRAKFYRAKLPRQKFLAC
jgi:hypothetical protein